MPFDQISPAQLRAMRVVTALMFLLLGAALAGLGALGALRLGPEVGGLPLAVVWGLPVAALAQGLFLANAGAMLLELISRPPFKVAINVPFVAANFQIALCVGLLAMGPALYFAPVVGAPAADPALPPLVAAGFAMNLMFVVMTQLHWNCTENTGKALP